MTNKKENECEGFYFWDKLSFILDESEGPEEHLYASKLFDVLDEILHRIKKLESKSHMHRSQDPNYKPPSLR